MISVGKTKAKVVLVALNHKKTQVDAVCIEFIEEAASNMTFVQTCDNNGDGIFIGFLKVLYL